MSTLQHCKSIGCKASWLSPVEEDHCPSCRKIQQQERIGPLDRPHFGHIRKLDAYRVIQLFEVSHPCLQEAIHNLLTISHASHEWQHEMVENTKQSLERWLDMYREDQEGAAVLAEE